MLKRFDKFGIYRENSAATATGWGSSMLLFFYHFGNEHIKSAKKNKQNPGGKYTLRVHSIRKIWLSLP